MSIFSKIAIRKPKRNKFNLSHGRKLTLDMGNLVPIYVQDVVPGDTFRVDTQSLIRMQPLQTPTMHNIDSWIHFHFVPTRLVWGESELYYTRGKDGLSTPAFPTITIATANKASFAPGSLADHLGLPSVDPAIADITSPLTISALPFRAYQLIYNEYFRDQNLSDPVPITKDSGPVTPAEEAALLAMRKRAWRKDIYTSALPQPQRGPEVAMPFEAEITYKDVATIKTQSGQIIADGNLGQFGYNGSTLPGEVYAQDGQYTEKVSIENLEDITSGTTSVNDLRKAVRLQEWLEKMARGGARYVEQILVMFGVRSSDARLQRPEFLGGGKTPLVISEVLSTYQNADDTGYPQGTMAGHGVGTTHGNGFKRTFEEHGYIIGVMSVLPVTEYMQGVPKHWTRFDSLEELWPQFGNLGEQEIKLKELYWNPAGTVEEQDETFGYTPRYAEHKFVPSTVHGQFRTSLAYWHMARIFTAKPVLNESFVMADPTKRIFAVETQDDAALLVNLYNRVDAVRPLPYFGTPTL